MKKNLLYRISIAILCLLSFSDSLHAQTITTVAGNGTAGYLGDGSPATSAEIFNALYVTIDNKGNIYIPDRNNQRVRMVNAAGTISTIAGTGIAGYTGDGYAATLAQLHSPDGIAVDTSGNIYVADGTNNVVRKIDPLGIITTVAGNSISGFGGDGGPATLASFKSIQGISLDAAGNLYIADISNNRVRKVSPATAGIVTTIAGNGTPGYSGDGIPATAAELHSPQYVAADNYGNVFIADYDNNRIRKVDVSGIISTFAGNGIGPYSGDGGPATAAQIFVASGVDLDACGNVYIADAGNNRIRKVNAAGIITTIAGNGTAAYGGDGAPATACMLNNPFGVKTDNRGDVFITDFGNHRVREIANRPPYFTAGHTQSITICADSTISVDSLLAVIDSDMQQGETWSILTAPVHGMLAAGYTTISTGGKLVPSGLSYATSGGYTGSDSFKVVISDCADLHDTTSVFVTVHNCALTSPPFGKSSGQAQRVTLYPNPGTGSFTISISTQVDEDAGIVITNLVGQKVKEFTANTRGPIDVHLEQPAGVYFLSVTTAGGRVVEKVVIAGR